MAGTGHSPGSAQEDTLTTGQGRRGLSRWPLLLIAGVALIVNVALVGGLLAGRNSGTGGAAAATCTDTAAASSPLDAVGTQLGSSPCIASRLAWTSATRFACGTWSATVTPDSTIATVEIYAAGHEGYQPYAGALPLSLHWGDTITEVTAGLGAPRVIYTDFGAPRLVYSVRGHSYRALELQFDSQGTLVEISATLTA